MNRSLIFLLAFALIGCRPPQTVVENPNDPPHNAPSQVVTPRPEPRKLSTGLPNATPSIDPNKQSNEKALRSELKKQQESQAEATRVEVSKPGTNQWIPAQVDPVDFGAQLDEVAKKWSGIAGSFEITLQNANLRGQQLGKFLIEDKSLYRIEYVDIDAPTGPNFVRADGTNKFVYHGSDIKKRPLGQSEPLESGAFYRLFTKQAFESFTEGRPTWSPILTNLRKQGYKMTLESKRMETGGVMRPFFRLIATKPGKGLNAFEARFDGIRLVPLTMKMNATDPKGKPIVAEWRAIWNFNQKVRKQLAKVP